MRTSLLFLSMIVALSACAEISDPVADVVAPSMAALPGSWGAATPLVGSSLINTAAPEGCPHESPNGRSLFFASSRTGNNDIYVTHRQPNGEWGEPERLPAPVNSTANDFCPTPLADGGLLFVSDRDDGLNCEPGKADIYQSRLHPTRGWLPVEHLGCVINSAGNEFSPSYVAAGGGMLFFSSDRTGTSGIYVSHRATDGSWGTPQLIGELGTPAFRPNVSADGREMVFDSNRSGSLGLDVWYSYRPTPHATWAAPVRLSDGLINSAGNETRPSFSRDGRRLYFGSTRSGNLDLYVAERQ
jgi:Tol biopolymer transport system component